jgi:cell division septation protein DedD
LETAIEENTKWLERVHVELLTLNNLTKDASLLAHRTSGFPPVEEIQEKLKAELHAVGVNPAPTVEEVKAAATKAEKPAKAEKPPKEEKVKAEPKAEAPKETPTGLTLADAQKMITKLVSVAGSDEAKGILAEFKAERVSALEQKDYPKFMARCQSVIDMM